MGHDRFRGGCLGIHCGAIIANPIDVKNGMKLPDICQTGQDIRAQYLALVGYMARIDGQLDDKEIALLKRMAVRFAISDRQQEQLFSNQTFSTKEIEAIFRTLQENQLQYSFILDLIVMAIADGVLQEAERLMLAHIAGLIGLQHEAFHNLINFAQATSSLDENGGHTDPMYQYVIEMFFHWARSSDVKLYQQTTFAINEKVDRALKKDL
jgi:uncharacterized tellurite resistance protein B-like protein